MHIEEQVFDAITGNLTHTVSQFSVVKDDDKLWLLKPRTYRAYGLSDSLPPCSTELLTPQVSSTSTLPLPTRPTIKVEPGLPKITLLSDDLEEDLPSQVPCMKTQDPSCVNAVFHPQYRIHVRRVDHHILNHPFHRNAMTELVLLIA